MSIQQLNLKKESPPPKKETSLAVVKKKEKDRSCKISIENAPPMILKSCGSIYSMSSPYGSLVSSPMTKEEINSVLTGKINPKDIPEPQALLVRTPDLALRPPIDFVKLWAQQLLDYDTEALCIYGVSRKNPEDWLAVVPDQEVTGASVDVDDFGPAASTLISKGYKVVGTLHTHPGGMTSCSTVDTGQLWNKFAGIHLIVTHTGILSFYFSTRGITWDLKSFKGFEHVVLFEKGKIPKALKKMPKLLGEDGTVDYRMYITKYVWAKTTTKGLGFGFGYDEYDDYDDYSGYSYKGEKSNLKYTNTAKTYYGTYNINQQKTEYVVQKRHTKVSVSYCDALGGYFDSITGGYYAGQPIKTGKHIKRYRVVGATKKKSTFTIVSDKKGEENKLKLSLVQKAREKRVRGKREFLLLIV